MPRPAPVTKLRREVALMTTPSFRLDLGRDLGRDLELGLLFRLFDLSGIVRIPCDRQ